MDQSLEHRKPFPRQNSDDAYQQPLNAQASFSGLDTPGSFEYFHPEGQHHDLQDDDDTAGLVSHQSGTDTALAGMPTSESPYGDAYDPVSPISLHAASRQSSVPGLGEGGQKAKGSDNGLGISTATYVDGPGVRPEQHFSQPSMSIDTALAPGYLPPSPVHESTAYDRKQADLLPLAHPYYVATSPISAKAPSFRRNRSTRPIASLKKSFQRGGAYARIEEEEDSPMTSFTKAPMSPTEPIGFDVSSMGGHHLDNVPLSALPRGGTRKGHRYTPSTEDNMLEQKGLLTGGLGRGMGTVRGLRLGRGKTKKGADENPLSPIQDYSLFSEDIGSSNRQLGQDAANKFGAIIAVEETVDFDITQADGGLITPSISSQKDGVDSQDKGATTHSYYYPDVEQPDWKPLVMRWWYIALVTLTALALAGVQEYLVQRSNHLSKPGEKGGLLAFKSAKDITLWDYFAWKYLPTIVLLTYGVMWQITDYEVKRLEAYFQLARKKGSPAERSLSLDYLTCFAIVAPFKALYNKHWAVLYSSTATLVSSGLVPILQQPSLNMYPDPKYRKIDEFKFVRTDPVWSRLTEAFLMIPAIAGILLFIQLRRKSGLKFDPKGIAGLAAMANRSHILVDFQGLDVATPERIHKQLKRRRYVLHNSCIWQGEYIRSSARSSSEEDDTKSAKNPHPFVFRLIFGIPYVGSLLLFMVLIPVFMFTPANKATQKAPWLLTTLATGLKIVWSNLDGNSRLLEPFYILSRRHAPARTLTLDYTGTAFGWMPIKALLNKHFLTAAVSFGAVLGEILVVCVSSFDVDGTKFFPGKGDITDDQQRRLFARSPQTGPPSPTPSPFAGPSQEDARYNSSETFKSFWISLGLSLGILTFLIVIALLVYLRRSHAFLPREPNSIASVLAYIHQSRMLYDFTSVDDEEIVIEDLDNAAMTKFLENKGKTYGMGWFRGRDGQGHMGIDEEELAASYTHGKDWKMGMIDSVGDWDRYE